VGVRRPSWGGVTFEESKKNGGKVERKEIVRGLAPFQERRSRRLEKGWGRRPRDKVRENCRETERRLLKGGIC